MTIPDITIDLNEFLNLKEKAKNKGIKSLTKDEREQYRYICIMQTLFKDPTRIKFIQFGLQLQTYSVSTFSRPLGLKEEEEKSLLAHLKQLLRYGIMYPKEKDLNTITSDTLVELDKQRFASVINIISPLMQMKKQKILQN